MGYELRRQLREVLGPNITGLQRAVALEIADDANEATRRSLAPLEDLVRWTGAKDGSVVRNALKRLAASGWEFRVPIGKGKDGRVLYAVPGRRMTFVVPPFEGVATATPYEGKGEQGLTQGVAAAPSEGATATPSNPQGGAGAHSEGATAHSEGAVATPSSSDPSDPSRDKDSSREAEHHLEAFGAFWLTYPKRTGREGAKKAWIAALDRGADPQRIVTAATAYANERANEDPKYTKHPANWLNKGCYDDEPETPPQRRLRVVGGHQPYQPPADHSVYENGF
ncbi:hypothetical protein C0R05_24470 [Streptomyces albidoflavus]|nr:hypothetical protein C0R05_24470 [Streptomyces albidoflavus]